VRVKKVLTEKQRAKALQALPDWKVNANGTFIKATFKQPDYISGLAFIARIAVHAEVLQHHPDITYTYSSVSVKLTTHDLKGVSELDILLAQKITTLVQKS
jgi:4a-hydroxytetrahydrobiopterin dehydratase